MKYQSGAKKIYNNLFDLDFALTEEEMNQIAGLDRATSSFFSHQDPAMVEWFVKMVEERKENHRSEKEKKNW